MSDIAAILNLLQLGSGAVIIIVAFIQVMLLKRRVLALRITLYTAFGLLVGGVAFGKYYAGEAPTRFQAIEASKPLAAIAGYTEAIQLSPSNAELYYRRGRTDFRLMKYAESVTDFTNALRLSPNTPKYLLGRAFAFILLGDNTSAERDLNEAVAGGYESSEASLIQGIIADWHANYQGAILQYTAALSGKDAGPYRCSALFARAYDYQREGKNRESIADYTTVIESCKGQSDEKAYERQAAFTNRGLLYWRSSQREAAFSDWEVALKLDPIDTTALFDRATSFQEIGNFERALIDINRYLDLHPDDPEAWMVRASLYEHLNKPKQASADLQHAQDLSTTGKARQYGHTIQTPFGPISTVDRDPNFRKAYRSSLRH